MYRNWKILIEMYVYMLISFNIDISITNISTNYQLIEREVITFDEDLTLGVAIDSPLVLPSNNESFKDSTYLKWGSNVGGAILPLSPPGLLATLCA